MNSLFIDLLCFSNQGLVQFQDKMASQERMRDLVVQSKRNSEDVHSYLTDLEGWQRDMEAKDNQLRGKTSQPTGLLSLSFDSFHDS